MGGEWRYKEGGGKFKNNSKCLNKDEYGERKGEKSGAWWVW